MKTIVVGSRGFEDCQFVSRAIEMARWTITEVVSGCARQIDRLGERWTAARNIPVERFPAEWERLGKAAGFLRNEQMARYAEALVALWDQNSSCSWHMVHRATELGLAVLVASTRDEILSLTKEQRPAG
jgi:YspA, cpYpsA-related SLOG family